MPPLHPIYNGNGNVSEYLEYVINADPGTAGNQPGATVAAHFEYDPFGNLILDSQGNAATLTYRFSTKTQDSISRSYYYGYR